MYAITALLQIRNDKVLIEHPILPKIGDDFALMLVSIAPQLDQKVSWALTSIGQIRHTPSLIKAFTWPVRIERHNENS